MRQRIEKMEEGKEGEEEEEEEEKEEDPSVQPLPVTNVGAAEEDFQKENGGKRWRQRGTNGKRGEGVRVHTAKRKFCPKGKEHF